MILYLSRIAILGVLITISGNVCAAAVEKDLAYGTDAAQKLDLSVPSAKGFPTVIFVHGGSLSSGDKADTDYKDVCTPFPDAGIGCANINYRLFPADAWPVPGEDVAAAVAWVKKNIGARGGNPEKLFLFGHSSGATLVALIAADEKYLAKFGVKTGAVAGVIPMGSIMWDDEIEQSITRNGRQRVEEGFARRSASWGSFDTYLSYWPFNHIHASMPPYLFLIAEAEQINPPVLMTNSKFAEKSRSIGNVADFEVIPGRNHYGNIRRLHEKDDPVFVLVRDFIKKYASDGKK